MHSGMAATGHFKEQHLKSLHVSKLYCLATFNRNPVLPCSTPPATEVCCSCCCRLSAPAFTPFIHLQMALCKTPFLPPPSLSSCTC
jgi:hypothetical protein